MQSYYSRETTGDKSYLIVSCQRFGTLTLPSCLGLNCCFSPGFFFVNNVKQKRQCMLGATNAMVCVKNVNRMEVGAFQKQPRGKWSQYIWILWAKLSKTDGSSYDSSLFSLWKTVFLNLCELYATSLRRIVKRSWCCDIKHKKLHLQ